MRRGLGNAPRLIASQSVPLLRPVRSKTSFFLRSRHGTAFAGDGKESPGSGRGESPLRPARCADPASSTCSPWVESTSGAHGCAGFVREAAFRARRGRALSVLSAINACAGITGAVGCVATAVVDASLNRGAAGFVIGGVVTGSNLALARN